MLKKYAKQFTLYGIGGVLTRFISVFTAPIYTRFLSTEEYGSLDLTITIYTILSIIISMEMHSGYGRNYYEAQKNNQLKKLRGTVYLLYFLSNALLLIFFFIFYKHLNGLFKTIDLCLLIPPVFNLLPMLLISLTLVTLKFEQKPLTHTKIAVANGTLTALGGIAAVTIFDYGVVGILWANTLVSYFVCIVIFIFLHDHTKFTPSFLYLKKTLIYSAPIVPARIGSWARQYIGRFFIAGALSLSALGIYSLAIKLSLILKLAHNAFKLTWDPKAIELFDKKDSEKKFVSLLNYYMFFMMSLVIAVVSFSPFIISVLAPPVYKQAVSIVGFLVVSTMWGGSSIVFAAGNNWERKTYYNTIGNITAAVLSLIILYIWINSGGIFTAAIALLCGSITCSLIILTTSQYNHKIPYSYKNIVIYLFASITYAFLSYFYFSTLRLKGIEFTVYMLITGAIIIFTWYLTIFSKIEREKIISFVKRILIQTK